MDFVIVDSTTNDFSDAIGISPERCLELSKKLDSMVGRWAPCTILRVADISKEIASFCDTIEEFAYCLILHMGWWQRRGHNLAPRK